MKKHRVEFDYSVFSLKDPSFWAVLFGNFLSIFIAIYQKWPLEEVMWIYWSQSVIIGLMNVVRILKLKEYSTDGLLMNGKAVPDSDPKAKRGIAFFFLMHYGIFHGVYFGFLWIEQPLSGLSPQDLNLLLVCVCGFFFAHNFSLLHNTGRDFKDKKPNIGTLMMYPYLRIIPMHITIVLGGAFMAMGFKTFVLIVFMLLKTIADAGMHVVEHHIFQKPDNNVGVMKD